MIKYDYGTKMINKNNGKVAIVEKILPDYVYLKYESGFIKMYTKSTFLRYWTPVERKPRKFKPEVLNEDGTFKGAELAKAFIKIVSSYNDDTILVQYDDKGVKPGAKIKISCRNYVIFYLNVCRAKLVVYSHPESLTPDNFRRANKIYPIEWNKSLRAKFIFESLTQTPLMKALIVDGIYYRKNM